MPVEGREGSAFGERWRRRFATRESRFRLAVTSGFTFVAIGFSVAAANTHVGFADTIWGAMPSFFGGASIFGQAPQYPQSAAVPQAVPSVAQHRRSASRRGGAPLQLAKAEAPVRLGRLSMCVRLCDGFAFPVGTYHGEQDRAAHEATCQSECPGAETALYVMPNGSDTIGDAVRVSSGKNYSELPDAFHYTTVLSEACTCHARSGGRIKSLLRDFTLRRGDAVMTAKGLQVFHGSPRYPYRPKDFLALNKSTDVRKTNRATFHAIERASVVSDQVGPAPKPVASTKHLEHQASR